MRIIENKIFKIMSLVLKVDLQALNENSNMDNLSEWDSLRHMNLILALEEEFSVSLPEEDVANLTSFKLLNICVSELVEKQK